MLRIGQAGQRESEPLFYRGGRYIDQGQPSKLDYSMHGDALREGFSCRAIASEVVPHMERSEHVEQFRLGSE